MIPRGSSVPSGPFPGPTSTVQNRIGFFSPVSSSIDSTVPTTSPPVVGGTVCTPSTSNPMRSNASVTSSVDVPGGRVIASASHSRERCMTQTSDPKAAVNRTSPSTRSRMSGIWLRNCRVRSMPIPNAKPL